MPAAAAGTAPSEMRRPEAAQRCAPLWLLADISAACIGAPRVRVTASAAVAPNATAAATRQPRRPAALIEPPFGQSARNHHLYPVTPDLPRPVDRLSGLVHPGARAPRV